MARTVVANAVGADNCRQRRSDLQPATAMEGVFPSKPKLIDACISIRIAFVSSPSWTTCCAAERWCLTGKAANSLKTPPLVHGVKAGIPNFTLGPLTPAALRHLVITILASWSRSAPAVLDGSTLRALGPSHTVYNGQPSMSIATICRARQFAGRCYDKGSKHRAIDMELVT